MKKTIFHVVFLVLLMGITVGLSAQSSTPNSPDEFDIANSALGGVKITRYNGTKTEVVIPNGVKFVAQSAFMSDTITTVTIPPSLANYGSNDGFKGAFRGGK